MELFESTIQRQIIDYLKMLLARGAVAWFCRVNGGMAQYGEQPVWNYTLSLPGFEDAHDGYSDLHGMLSNGRYFAIEVKRNGKKPTKPQRRFLDAVRHGNGIAIVAYRFEDVQNALRERRTRDDPAGRRRDCVGDRNRQPTGDAIPPRAARPAA